jgi:hypothetical protein
MSAVATAYRQQGGGKRPASQAANRLKKKPALGLLHKKNPLQGELPERAAPHAQDIYTYPFDVLTHPVFDAENMQGSTIREHVANIQRGSGHWAQRMRSRVRSVPRSSSMHCSSHTSALTHSTRSTAVVGATAIDDSLPSRTASAPVTEFFMSYGCSLATICSRIMRSSLVDLLKYTK